MNAESGLSRRAGVFVTQPTGYRAFIPNPLPPDPSLIVGPKMQCQLGEAERYLGRLDSVSLLVPDPDRFVFMYVRQEAVLSSQIEGTQASLSDLLEYEAAQHEGERTVDVGEVVNYLKALDRGLKLVKKLPVSTRLLCAVHQELTAGVRGGEPAKAPGELRRTQNWIGGSSPADARFVPPPPHEMQRAMSDLEKFLNTRKNLPLLIEVGMAHAQFETIHPFLDGNGRIGRLLITFLLATRGVLSKPLLYFSHYLKSRRDEYYELLQRVRTHGDWEGWTEFFLSGVGEVAREATERAKQVIALRQKDQALVREKLGRRAGLGLDFHDLLIEQPVVTSRLVQSRLRRTQPTVDKLIADFLRAGILRETSGQRWGRKFAYRRYLSIFERPHALPEAR